MEMLLSIWRARLDALQVKAYARARPENHGPLHAWRAKGEAAFAKLAELRAAREDGWSRLKEELEHAWRDLIGPPG